MNCHFPIWRGLPVSGVSPCPPERCWFQMTPGRFQAKHQSHLCLSTNMKKWSIYGSGSPVLSNCEEALDYLKFFLNPCLESANCHVTGNHHHHHHSHLILQGGQRSQLWVWVSATHTHIKGHLPCKVPCTWVFAWSEVGRRPGVTTGREEMCVAGGYSPHLVVVMASQADTYAKIHPIIIYSLLYVKNAYSYILSFLNWTVSLSINGF